MFLHCLFFANSSQVESTQSTPKQKRKSTNISVVSSHTKQNSLVSTSTTVASYDKQWYAVTVFVTLTLCISPRRSCQLCGILSSTAIPFIAIVTSEVPIAIFAVHHYFWLFSPPCSHFNLWCHLVFNLSHPHFRPS